MSGSDSQPNSKGITVRRRPIRGYGVISTLPFEPGSTIGYFDGDEVPNDTRYSLTLDGVKIEPTGKLAYLNHACDPNAGWVGRTLVASRYIECGEEVTINYLETESQISFAFQCECGNEDCMGLIGKGSAKC